MKRFSIGLVVLLVIVAVHQAQATVILSGDSNIVDGGSGNQQFFSNVLAGGSTVLMQDTNAGDAAGIPRTSSMNSYYNSLAGVSSSIHSGAVTSSALAGVDLYMAVLPSHAYSASEIAALAGFEAGGGTIFFIGEYGGWTWGGYTQAIVNDVLAGLGSGMSLNNTLVDVGSHTATGSRIASDPYTAGVTSFYYAGTATATISGGTALFYTLGMSPFIAYEGGVVPEPTTFAIWSILGLAFAGIGWRHRRKAA